LTALLRVTNLPGADPLAAVRNAAKGAAGEALTFSEGKTLRAAEILETLHRPAQNAAQK